MDQKISHLVKTLDKWYISIFFNKWKAAIGSQAQNTPKKVKINEKENKGSEMKRGSFNLMFVKKDGENYTVQDVKDILKKKQQQKLK